MVSRIETKVGIRAKTGLGIFVRGGMSTGNRIANNTITAGSNGIFAICYNPTPDDPMGPRGRYDYGQSAFRLQHRGESRFDLR